jgi:hypothetical protein
LSARVEFRIVAKTFTYQGQHLICPFEPAAWRKEQKFFVSFFQKRNTFFFRWRVSLYAGCYKARKEAVLL